MNPVRLNVKYQPRVDIIELQVYGPRCGISPGCDDCVLEDAFVFAVLFVAAGGGDGYLLAPARVVAELAGGAEGGDGDALGVGGGVTDAFLAAVAGGADDGDALLKGVLAGAAGDGIGE